MAGPVPEMGEEMWDTRGMSQNDERKTRANVFSGFPALQNKQAGSNWKEKPVFRG